ncbi:uncharacterized protein [Choristoneura fumiferana]|uniref:uncharacterized protein n=1 Tax=Choristoneura fumiferana TaxID=7141 RepID=UPI003D155C4F
MEQVLHSQLQLYLSKVEECKRRAEGLLRQETIQYEEIIEKKISLKIYHDRLTQTFEKYLQTSETLPEVFMQQCIEVQAAAEDTLINIEVLVQTQEQVKRVQPTTSTAVTRLPKLSLPKFNGNVLEFTEFWDRFESSIGNQTLNDVDKLTYLLGCLSGTALDTIRGLPTTNSNYNIAVKALQDRFGNKTLTLDAHFKALSELKRANDSAESCRFTLNALEKNLRILKNLGEDVNSNHLRVVIMSKFPERILYEVNVLNGINSNAEKTIQGLERIITAMEIANEGTKVKAEAKDTATTEALHIRAARKRKNEAVDTETCQQTKRKPQQHPWAGSRQARVPVRPDKRKSISIAAGHTKRVKYEITCVFCTGEHYSYLCKQVTSNKDRRKKLSSASRCFNCFGVGHYAYSCRYRQTCAFCGGSHNRALCPRNGESLPKHKKNETHMYNYNNSYSFLQTATVEVKAGGRTSRGRVLLDSGSQRSYITSNLASKLDIKIDGEDQLLVYTFGAEKPKEVPSSFTNITLKTKRGIEKLIRVNIVPYITSKIPIPDTSNLPVDIIADDDNLGESIDLLIGNDYYFSFIHNETVRLDENLYVINTDFGWIVSGNLKGEPPTKNTLSVLTYCHCHEHNMYFSEPDLPLQNRDMKFLWSLESIGITDSPKTTIDEEAIEHFNKTVKYKRGRYLVKWPWTQSPPDLPTNYGLAYGRLKGLLNRLDPDTLQEYDKILKEQLNMNIIEKVINPGNAYHQTTPPVHYLAHHMVKQEGKRGRIVYDASAKLKDQKGLNECMYRGPSMLQELTSLILKFRTNKIGIVADVEKAFLQIGLQEHDRDVTRFLWIKDPDKPLSEDNLIHLRFCRVPFGIISSPFLLTASIRYHMAKTNPQLLSKIADKCYVDNLVTGAASQTEAYELYEETNKTFEELSMNIRDWNSNDETFLQTIPKTQQAIKADVTKVLGLMWNLKRDTLRLNIKEHLLNKQKIKSTKDKREVLSVVASLYDPCGYVSPLILPAKLLFQEICNSKLKWDAELSDDLKAKWERVAAKLKLAEQVEIPRFVGLPQSKEVKYELHCFTDASKDSFAAVVYIRSYNGKQSKISLLMSKARVTPSENKDNLQIPRLELLGYVIGSRLLKYVKNALELPIEKEYLWTDSQVVLNESYWPNNRHFKGCHTLVAGESLDTNGPDGSEIDVDVMNDEQNISIDEVEATQETQEAVQINNGIDCNQIMSSDTQAIKKMQEAFFPEEVKGKVTHLSRNLGLFLDVDGVLRCKGRMGNTDWTYDKKHPILIPKGSPLTDDIVRKTHETNYHVGVPHTLSLVRQRYWIPGGRAEVQRILRKCPQCIKHGGGPYQLPHAPALPAERVSYSSPFTYTGIDYFGPVYIDAGKVLRRGGFVL